MKLISDDDLLRIDRHLRLRLEELLCKRTGTDDELAAMNRQIVDYTLAGGKRIRPQLTAWTYRQFSGDANNALSTTVLDGGVVWELFHAFLLIHDDIIDQSDTRRDHPSLHRSLAGMYGPRSDGRTSDCGTHLAIVAGDLLFSAAIHILHHMQAADGPYRQMLQLFSRVACETGFGQAVDICVSHAPLGAVSEASLLREYHWKTAAYTFEGPMLAGAILAGAGDAAKQAISGYALSLGQAYQMQNDLIDLARPVSAGSDLLQGKRTVTLVRARAALETAALAEFDALVEEISQGGEAALEKAERLRQRLLAGEAVQQTRQAVANLLEAARHSTEDAGVPAAAGQSMREMLGALKKAYFV